MSDFNLKQIYTSPDLKQHSIKLTLDLKKNCMILRFSVN